MAADSTTQGPNVMNLNNRQQQSNKQIKITVRFVLQRAVLGIEPRTSRTRSENDTIKPNSQADAGPRSVHVCNSINILKNESSLHNFAAKLEPLHNGTIHVRLKHRHRIYMKLEFHTIEPDARLSISQCGK